MDLQKYTEAAIKTESVIDSIKTNENRLLSILEILIGAGNLLDDLKKNIFYNRDIDTYKFNQHYNVIKNGIESLQILDSLASEVIDQNMLKSHDIEVDTRIFHGVVGITTESIEMLEALYEYITKGKLDKINLGEECGDIAWYQAILLNALEQNWDDNMNKNIEKLKARYESNNFTNSNANNRNLNNERKILEK